MSGTGRPTKEAGMTLTAREFRMLCAAYEARFREAEAATHPHRDLIVAVCALAEHHPEYTSGQIARIAARMFYEGDKPTADAGRDNI